jgi:hypothetical protein
MELTVRQQTIFDIIVKMYHSVPFGTIWKFHCIWSQKNGKSYLYRALKEHFLNKSNNIVCGCKIYHTNENVVQMFKYVYLEDKPTSKQNAFNQVLKPSKAHLCCYHSIKIYFCYKDLFEEPHTRVGTTADFVGLRGPSVIGIFDLYDDYHCRYNKNPPSLLQQTKSYIINFNIKTPFDIPFCIRFNP